MGKVEMAQGHGTAVVKCADKKLWKANVSSHRSSELFKRIVDEEFLNRQTAVVEFVSLGMKLWMSNFANHHWKLSSFQVNIGYRSIRLWERWERWSLRRSRTLSRSAFRSAQESCLSTVLGRDRASGRSDSTSGWWNMMKKS